MAHLDYVYHEQSRRPIVFLATAIGGAMIALGTWHGAPWWTLAPVLIGVSMSLWMLVFNRRSGMELSGPEMLLYNGTWRRSLRADQIVSARIVHWSEGAPSVSIDLTGGERLDIPAMCIGSAAELSAAFTSRSIPIIEVN